VHNDYAERIRLQLKAQGIRVQADLGSERMNNKIRQAQLMKVPYMLVVGDQEMANESVALRKRNGERNNSLPLGEFVATVKEKIATRSAEL
jgi:threonyl-tRNA synthetase